MQQHWMNLEDYINARLLFGQVHDLADELVDGVVKRSIPYRGDDGDEHTFTFTVPLEWENIAAPIIAHDRNGHASPASQLVTHSDPDGMPNRSD